MASNDTFDPTTLRDLHTYSQWSGKWKEVPYANVFTYHRSKPSLWSPCALTQLILSRKPLPVDTTELDPANDCPLTTADLSLRPVLKSQPPHLPLLTRHPRSLFAQPPQLPLHLLCQLQATPIFLQGHPLSALVALILSLQLNSLLLPLPNLTLHRSFFKGSCWVRWSIQNTCPCLTKSTFSNRK